MFVNKYEEDTDLPTVANKLADIIVELEKAKNLEKYHHDDFIHEYSDEPVEEDTTSNQYVRIGNDDISKTEEKFGFQSASLCENLKDEIYLSDDEPDLLNEAVAFKYEDVYITDTDDDLESLDPGNKENSEELNLNLDVIKDILPETCLEDSKKILEKLSICLDQYDEKKGKSYLIMLNELSFKILEKVDQYCGPSIERKKLSKSLNDFCDKIDKYLRSTGKIKSGKVQTKHF